VDKYRTKPEVVEVYKQKYGDGYWVTYKDGNNVWYPKKLFHEKFEKVENQGEVL
jgi:hypothetical protein